METSKEFENEKQTNKKEIQKIEDYKDQVLKD